MLVASGMQVIVITVPCGYVAGDVEDCLIQPISQGQFTPLPEALCWVVLDLTASGQVAVLDTIRAALHVAFPEMERPSKDLVYDTLAKLMADRKVSYCYCNLIKTFCEGLTLCLQVVVPQSKRRHSVVVPMLLLFYQEYCNFKTKKLIPKQAMKVHCFRYNIYLNKVKTKICTLRNIQIHYNYNHKFPTILLHFQN